ncbi:hypothetical protein TPA0905_51040 [Streptomyces olivaceus]|nr:hypothetical protein TPA0905_51040 [Streptomyces olivaceus]
MRRGLPGLRYLAAVSHDPNGVIMERHVLESLLIGDDEASAITLAALRSDATTRWRRGHNPRVHTPESSVADFSACRCTGSNPLGLERAVKPIREYDRPVAQR